MTIPRWPRLAACSAASKQYHGITLENLAREETTLALFTKKQNVGNPTEKSVSGGDSAATEKRQSELRGISGFASIGDVKAAAPSSTVGETVNATGKTSGRASPASSRIASVGRKTTADVEADRKAAKRQLALETAGRAILKKAAKLPYETWAILASDSDMELTPEQARDLADTYFEIAQGFDIDFSNPYILLFGMAGMHVDLVATRIKITNEKEKAKKAQRQAELSGTKPN